MCQLFKIVLLHVDKILPPNRFPEAAWFGFTLPGFRDSFQRSPGCIRVHIQQRYRYHLHIARVSKWKHLNSQRICIKYNENTNVANTRMSTDQPTDFQLLESSWYFVKPRNNHYKNSNLHKRSFYWSFRTQLSEWMWKSKCCFLIIFFWIEKCNSSNSRHPVHEDCRARILSSPLSMFCFQASVVDETSDNLADYDINTILARYQTRNSELFWKLGIPCVCQLDMA